MPRSRPARCLFMSTLDQAKNRRAPLPRTSTRGPARGGSIRLLRVHRGKRLEMPEICGVKRNREACRHRSDHGVLKLDAVVQVEAGRLPHRPAIIVFRGMLDAKLAQEANRLSAFRSIGRTLDRLHPDHGCDGQPLSPEAGKPARCCREGPQQIDENGGVENCVGHHEYRGEARRIVSTYSAPLCSSLPSVQAPISGDEAISSAVSPSPLRSSSVSLRSSSDRSSRVTTTRPRGVSGGSSTSRCPSSVISPSTFSAFFMMSTKESLPREDRRVDPAHPGPRSQPTSWIGRQVTTSSKSATEP